MPAAVSQDLRKRVVKAYEDGEGSFCVLGLRFGVGEASVNRWVSLKRKFGHVTPKPRGGSAPKPTLAVGDHTGFSQSHYFFVQKRSLGCCLIHSLNSILY